MYHVFDKCTQSSTFVASIIEHITRRFWDELPVSMFNARPLTITDSLGWIKISLRSDNAGCYKNSYLFQALPKIAKDNQVVFSHISFSEAGSGKSACDRAAAMIKTQVRSAVDGGMDATDGKEFIEAAQSRKKLEGMSFFLAEFDGAEGDFRSVQTIPLISRYHDFKYSEPMNELRVWNHYKIGTGFLLPPEMWRNDAVEYKKLKILHESHWRQLGEGTKWRQLRDGIDITQLAEEHNQLQQQQNNNDEFDGLTGEVEETDVRGEPVLNLPERFDGEDFDDSQLVYDCPVEGCSKFYQKYKNLEKHLLIGKHDFVVDRVTMRDTALLMYRSGLERSSMNSIFPELKDPACLVSEATTECSAEQEPRLLEEGWALKEQKECKRFSEKVIGFLLSKFNERYLQNKRADPKSTVQQMINAKDSNGKNLFSVDELLTEAQIRSFFSREAAKRRKSAASNSVEASNETPRKRRRKDCTTVEVCATTAEEVEQVCDYEEEGVMNDPIFDPVQDAMDDLHEANIFD